MPWLDVLQKIMNAPLPPGTILQLAKLWPHARKKGHEIGEIRRVGYYSPQDGLDCIWLVDVTGNYNWTADHKWVSEMFTVIRLSDETDFYGKTKRRLGLPEQSIAMR